MANKNPWDKVFSVSQTADTTSPKAILTKFVDAFNSSSHRNPKLSIKLITRQMGETQFKHDFYLTAPSLEYATLLFYVVHSLHTEYPATFHVPSSTGDSLATECTDAKQMQDTIESHITSKTIIDMINNLIKIAGK